MSPILKLNVGKVRTDTIFLYLSHPKYVSLDASRWPKGACGFRGSFDLLLSDHRCLDGPFSAAFTRDPAPFFWRRVFPPTSVKGEICIHYMQHPGSPSVASRGRAAGLLCCSQGILHPLLFSAGVQPLGYPLSHPPLFLLPHPSCPPLTFHPSSPCTTLPVQETPTQVGEAAPPTK